MYIGWQHRIFPYAPFDVFVEGLEKLGSSYVLKVLTMSNLNNAFGGMTCWSGICYATQALLRYQACLDCADGVKRVAV